MSLDNAMNSVDKNIVLCKAWLFVASVVEKGESAVHQLKINLKEFVFFVFCSKFYNRHSTF
jgi:hypothetical protein